MPVDSHSFGERVEDFHGMDFGEPFENAATAGHDHADSDISSPADSANIFLAAQLEGFDYYWCSFLRLFQLVVLSSGERVSYRFQIRPTTPKESVLLYDD